MAIVAQKFDTTKVDQIMVYLKGTGNPEDQHAIIGIQIGDLLIGYDNVTDEDYHEILKKTS